jgi:hypothetical protein
MSDDVDLDALPTLRETVLELTRAYYALTSGNKRLRVRFQDRWTEYNPANATQLLVLVRTLRTQCTDCSDIPDLNPGRRTERGPPAFLRIS